MNRSCFVLLAVFVLLGAFRAYAIDCQFCCPDCYCPPCDPVIQPPTDYVQHWGVNINVRFTNEPVAFLHDVSPSELGYPLVEPPTGDPCHDYHLDPNMCAVIHDCRSGFDGFLPTYDCSLWSQIYISDRLNTMLQDIAFEIRERIDDLTEGEACGVNPSCVWCGGPP